MNAEISIRLNLLDLVKNLLKPGAFQEGDVLCLKTPTMAPNLNICWGLSGPEDLQKARTFYKGKTFGYIEEDVSIPCSFSFPAQISVEIIEMILTKPVSFQEPLHPTCKINLIENDEGVKVWAALAEKIFSLNPTDGIAFVGPASRLAGADFFVAYENETPVGIGHVYLDENGLACIFSIGVCEEFRRQGIGTALMKWSINRAIHKKARSIALHASQEGLKLYETLGFRSLRTSRFSISLPEG
jgi:GNAT superfamily N-acetyltransferase